MPQPPEKLQITPPKLSELTEQQIRVLVSRSLGREIKESHRIYPTDDYYFECEVCKQGHIYSQPPPSGPCPGTDNDYCNSLDACSEFEKAIHEPNILTRDIQRRGVWNTYLEHLERLTSLPEWDIIMASPLDRCRAYLLTRNLATS